MLEMAKELGWIRITIKSVFLFVSTARIFKPECYKFLSNTSLNGELLIYHSFTVNNTVKIRLLFQN